MLINRYNKEDVLYETILSKLGSRISIVPRANKGKINHGILGFNYDRPVQFTMATYQDKRVKSLPFSTKYVKSYRDVFEFIEQEIGMTYIAYHCRSSELSFDIRFTISAPFYPGDIKLSIAPFFYLIVEVSNKINRKTRGSILVALENVFADGISRKASSKLFKSSNLTGAYFEGNVADNEGEVLATNSKDITFGINDYDGKLYTEFAQEGRLSNTIRDIPTLGQSCGICWEFELEPGKKKEKVFILTGYHSGSALNVNGEGKKFLYTRYFKDVEDVSHYAWSCYDEIEKKVNKFEDTLAMSSLPDYTKKLIAYSFHSYVANTWLIEGEPYWYTVWEGWCKFHSTLDVAYNTEVFSLLYWPALLKRQLEEWADYTFDGYMPHDIGDELRICGQTYDHDMPVEENTNYLLLLYAYWRFTGDKELLKKNYRLIRKLIEYLVDTDHDKDGIPDERYAVKNTVDTGSKVVGGSKGQTYLGVKTYASFIAGKYFAIENRDKTLYNTCEDRIQKISRTLKTKLWYGDHFAICSDENYTDRGGYHIYASNGLYYLFLTGTEVPLPLDYFKTDIESHMKQLMRKYGCSHSSSDCLVWVSQNVVRDKVGMYLGIDTLENTEKYWKLQLDLGSSFVGTFQETYFYGYQLLGALDSSPFPYPRGAGTFGYIYALGGIGLDRVARRLVINPQSCSLKIPLVTEADWDKLAIPWLRLERVNNGSEFEISEFRNLSKGIHTLIIYLPTEEKPSLISLQHDRHMKISDIMGKSVRLKNGLKCKIKKIEKDSKKGIWRTVIELILGNKQCFLSSFKIIISSE